MLRVRTSCLSWVLLVVLAFSLPFPVRGAGTDAKQSLALVRARIKKVEAHIAHQIESRDSTAKALKTIELRIAKAEHKLAGLREQVRSQHARIDVLHDKAMGAKTRLAGERQALARQIRLSYMTGHDEFLRLLLSQQSPARVGRMTVYYGYLNRARTQRIQTVKGELSSLTRLQAKSRQVQADLADLAKKQSAQLAALGRTRDQRKELLAKLGQSISSDQAKVGKLKRQAQHLTDLINQLNKVMADFPTNPDQPFSEARGSLPWPVQGQVTGSFGEEVQGGPVRRDGVVLSSPEGTPVRSIYYGRVAFANWLPGQGLLIVIDHGDGYMSLYGHNQALLKEVGDWVTAGEPIARVGETGGQPTPSLYFEICHDGKPLDPNRWMAN